MKYKFLKLHPSITHAWKLRSQSVIPLWIRVEIAMFLDFKLGSLPQNINIKYSKRCILWTHVMNSIAFQKKLNKKRMHSSCKHFCSSGIMKKSTSCKLLNEIRGLEIIKYSKHCILEDHVTKSIGFWKKIKMLSSCKPFCGLEIMTKWATFKLLNEVRGLEIAKYKKCCSL